jgi:sodium/hydrogen exchanger-like protein 6/7
MSGIVSLLVCSLLQSHYAWYNLSPQGQHVTSVTFQTLGYISEAAVFAYIGLSATHYIFNTSFCWKFVLAEFFIIIIGRYIAIYSSYYTFACCKGKKANKLEFSQLTFISFAALIRGAIAFGLVTKVPTGEAGISKEKKDILLSSTLALVIITTVLFGSFTNIVQKCLLKPNMPEITVEDEDEDGVTVIEKNNVDPEDSLNLHENSN